MRIYHGVSPPNQASGFSCDIYAKLYAIPIAGFTRQPAGNAGSMGICFAGWTRFPCRARLPPGRFRPGEGVQFTGCEIFAFPDPRPEFQRRHAGFRLEMTTEQTRRRISGFFAD